MKKLLASFSVLGLVSFATSAQTIFSDDFEGGTLANWTTSNATTPNPLTIASGTNAVPLGGNFSAYADLSADRMHHNIIADNGGNELSGPAIFTSWIFDSSMTRAYVQALSYSGTGIPNGGTTADGTLGQLLAIGKYSSVTMTGEVFDATKYQARVVLGTTTGWFNLNGAGAPSRSPGWHKFTIEKLGTSVNFYVDDILSRTITGATDQSWDTITMGFGTSSSSNGESAFDGILVAVPEPSGFALAGLGAAALLIFRRRQ